MQNFKFCATGLPMDERIDELLKWTGDTSQIPVQMLGDLAYKVGKPIDARELRSQLASWLKCCSIQRRLRVGNDAHTKYR
jgi:hypothetical protein